LLAGDELLRSPEEDFARPVPPNFAAQGTLNGDGLEGELLQAGGHIAAAPLARHDEHLAA